MNVNNINWNIYYQQPTLHLRREYLRKNVFKVKKRAFVNYLFVVRPVSFEEKTLIKFGKQTLNFFRRLLRHFVLPFPITWTHKNSDRLVQKRVISMEDYFIGPIVAKDIFSGLRIGVSQYVNLLLSGGFASIGVLVSLAVASKLTLGILPAIALGFGGVYLGYLVCRTLRKSNTTKAYLKDLCLHSNEKRNDQKLFAEMYTLVNLLENDKKTIELNSVEQAKEYIIITIENRTLSCLTENEPLNRDFSKLVEDIVNPFIKTLKSSKDIITKNQLSEALDKLIYELDNFNIREEYIKLKLAEKKSKEETVEIPVNYRFKYNPYLNQASNDYVTLSNEEEKVDVSTNVEKSKATVEKVYTGFNVATNADRKASLHDHAKSTRDTITDQRVLNDMTNHKDCSQKLIIKKVIESKVKELVDNKKFKEALIVKEILRSSNFDKSLVVLKIINSDLLTEDKFSLIKKLEEKISVMSCTPNSKNVHVNGTNNVTRKRIPKKSTYVVNAKMNSRRVAV